MELIRSKSRVVSFALFFLDGFIFVCASMIEHHYKPALLYSIIGFWFVSMVLLFLFMPKRKHTRLYVGLHMISFIILALLEQIYLDENYLVYLIFMIQWMMALMLCRVEVLYINAWVQIISYAIMAFVPYLSQFTGYDYKELIVLTVVELCSIWIGRTLVTTIQQIERDRDEQERSMDDMLSLVEKKHYEAKAATLSKSTFLSNMSHEIRTPINTVLGMNEMIQRESYNEVVLGYSDNIKNAGKMLLNLVNDILDFSKIESGKMELVLSEYDLRAVIVDLNNMVSGRIRDKGLEFKIQLDPTIPVKYYGDDIRIRQIIINLLTNAAKYTNSGSVTLWIKGENCGDMERLHVCVEDTGIGIKEENLKKLNQKFIRIDESRNRNIEGTGLGITIVNSFLNLMDSKLNVTSEYDKGSKFYFDIEQRIVDSTPIGHVDDFINLQKEKEVYRVSFTAPDARLLVVDDNPMNLKVFTALLKETKCRIDTAESGRKALELIRQNKYDIIFMDHLMPEMDGVETLRRMREIPDCVNGSTPVLAFTANAMAGAKEMYAEKGFAGFLTKPVEIDKLEENIKNLLPEELINCETEADNNTPDKGPVINSYNAAPADAEEDVDFDSLPAVEGLDWRIGYLHTSNIDVLLDVTESCIDLFESEADEIAALYKSIVEDNDSDALDMLRIKAHSLKSTAALIGLIPLAGTAAMLEYAARDGNHSLIENVTMHFVDECHRYASKLTAAFAD